MPLLQKYNVGFLQCILHPYGLIIPLSCNNTLYVSVISDNVWFCAVYSHFKNGLQTFYYPFYRCILYVF